MKPLEQFTAAYIEALYFSDTGDTGQPNSDAELSAKARADIEADCRSFWRRFGCYITADICRNAFPDPISQAGHDFHFTRNGHGVGFWEDEWPEPYRDRLAKGARGYGELHIFSTESDPDTIHVHLRSIRQ